jgi:hypothetical protein
MDSISLQILEDGTVTVKTSDISDSNHISADELLSQVEMLLGGKVVVTNNPEKRQHVHLANKVRAH